MTRFDPGQHGPELSAYLDGELEAPRAAEIEQLLAESPEARVYLDELRTVANGLRALPRLSAPDALRATLRAQATSGRSAPGTRGTWIIALRTGAIAAALGIAWIAGQSMLGPLNAPHAGTLRRDEPVFAAREKDGKQDKSVETETAVALGVPAAREEPAYKLPGAPPAPPPSAALDAVAAARTPAAVATPPDDSDAAFARGAGRAGEFASGDVSGDATTDSVEDLPAGEVEVVINARTPAEFTAVNSLLLSFQNAPVELNNNTNYMAQVAEPDGGQMHQLEVQRSEVRALVAELEDRAPQNVQVQELAVADGESDFRKAAADETAPRDAAAPAAKPAGSGGGARSAAREQAKKEAPPRRPARTRPEGGSDAAAEGAARNSAESPPPAPAVGRAAPTQPVTGVELQQRPADRANRNAGRAAPGGRIVYRGLSQRQIAQLRGAAIERAETQPIDQDDTVVVNVLVAPPAPLQQTPAQSQSQPASRSSP